MNIYTRPEIIISSFDTDCVLTASGYTKETTSNLPSVHSDKNETENPAFIKNITYSDMAN